MNKEMQERYKFTKLLLYFALVLGLGYTFINKMRVYELKSYFVIGIIIALVLGVVLIELVTRIFIKALEKK